MRVRSLVILFGLLVLAVLAGCSDGGSTTDRVQATGPAETSQGAAGDTNDAGDTSDAADAATADADTESELEAAALPTPTSRAVDATTAEPVRDVDVAQSDESPVPVLPVAPVVYAGDFGTSIAPIFAGRCASCHNAGGPGARRWELEQADDLVDTHEWIASIVSAGVMPPWPASELSLTFHDARSLRSDEIEAIRQWSADGAPLDVEPTLAIVAPDGTDAFDVDVEIAPHESVQGSPIVTDDYRCLIYDLDLAEARWLQGFEFVPDQTSIVHHALGYLVPASQLERAQALSDEDDEGGWQCYGGSGLDGDSLLLGWAPGQLATRFPEGSGVLAQPGDFMVLQIHYHVEVSAAPKDRSTIRLDWSESDDLDPIAFDEFIGPAEIPCADSESGPLCDRDLALARAYERFGIEGVLADGINSLCGVTPEDFAGMTSGIATSTCTIPLRSFGELVAVFAHQHELGKSIRMTLNAGRSDELVLLDIPDWSFDWQYNYYPVDPVIVEPGDTLLLECEWDRARRSADLEPAYVLWADGTDDEMCFGTITTRQIGDQRGTVAGSRPREEPGELRLDVPQAIAACLADDGVGLDPLPGRDEIDPTVDALFRCSDAAAIGELLAGQIEANFGGLIGPDGITCLATGLSTMESARDLLRFALDDSTAAERRPVAELVGDCVSLSDALAQFGFPLPAASRDCVDAAGRELLVDATIAGTLPEEQALFGAINPCLSGS